MKRLIMITAAATVVLLIVSLTHGRAPVRHVTASPTNPAAITDPADVARTYLTALLTGDLRVAEANSTPLLATELASHPPHLASLDAVPLLNLLMLERTATSTDIAVEMHWADGRVAALRVQLGLLDGRWLVAGIQP